jgi:hypothetical protein
MKCESGRYFRKLSKVGSVGEQGTATAGEVTCGKNIFCLPEQRALAGSSTLKEERREKTGTLRGK